jgi:hypothetical protein
MVSYNLLIVISCLNKQLHTLRHVGKILLIMLSHAKLYYMSIPLFFELKPIPLLISTLVTW